LSLRIKINVARKCLMSIFYMSLRTVLNEKARRSRVTLTYNVKYMVNIYDYDFLTFFKIIFKY